MCQFALNHQRDYYLQNSMIPHRKKEYVGGLEITRLLFHSGPEKIDFSGETSTRGDGDGGDSDMSDGRCDSTVDRAGALGSSGDDVGGGIDEGAERGRDGEGWANLVQEATEPTRRIVVGVEAAKEWELR